MQRWFLAQATPREFHRLPPWGNPSCLLGRSGPGQLGMGVPAALASVGGGSTGWPLSKGQMENLSPTALSFSGEHKHPSGCPRFHGDTHTHVHMGTCSQAEPRAAAQQWPLSPHPNLATGCFTLIHREHRQSPSKGGLLTRQRHRVMRSPPSRQS